MIKYAFREVVTIMNKRTADPQQIGEALDRISAEHGGKLIPDDVVKAATSPAHILHQHFEWDDAKAAHAHRIDQARGIVRSIVRVDDEEDTVPAFISIADKSTGVSYRKVEEVETNVDLQKIALRAAERDLLAFEKRHRTLADICDDVRRIREKISEKLQPQHA